MNVFIQNIKNLVSKYLALNLLLFYVFLFNTSWAQPANNECTGAVTLTVNAACANTAGTTTGSTGNAGNPAPCVGTADDDVWYKFTANSPDQKITVSCNSGFDPVVQIFSGSCGTLISQFCQDDGGDGVSEILDLTGFGVGSTYFVRVFHYYTGVGTGNFNICVTGTTPALNDEPCTAIDLPEVTSACVYSIYSLASATNTATPGSPGCGWAGKDIWFKALIPPNGKIDISTYTVSGGISDPTMAIYSGSVCSSLTLISCDDNSGPGNMPYLNLSGRTPGEIIWIRVSFSTSIGDGRFKLCVSSPVNDECGSSLFVCDINGFSGSTLYTYTIDMETLEEESGGIFGQSGDGVLTSIENNSWLAFTASATTASLNVTIADCWNGQGIQMEIMSGTCGNVASFVSNSNYLQTTTSQTITATGLTVGNTYYLMIDGYAGDVCNYTITGTSGVKSLTVTPATANVCNGSSITLTANPVGFGNATYSWYSDPPGFSGSSATVTANPVEYTKYYVVVTGSCNEVQEANSTINVPNPNKEFTWTGGGVTTSDNWQDVNNWGSFAGCLPDCNNSVTIPSSPSANATNFPKLNSAGACKHLVIQSDPAPSDANYSLSIFNSGNLSVCGNISLYGTMPINSHYTSNASSRITFSGSTPQFFYASALSSNNLPSITLNNSNGLTILDGKDASGTYKDLSINPSGNLVLSSGIINTSGARNLVVNNPNTNAITSYSTNSYINGRLTRAVNATGSYDFPVGNSTGYELANININSVSGGLTSINAFFEPAFDETDLIQTPNVLEPDDINKEYEGFLNNGGSGVGSGTLIPNVWTITPNSGSANYSISLYGRNYSNASGFVHTVGKRNTPTTCLPSWSASGSYSTNSNVGNVVSASRTNVTGFSQFVILRGLNVLPISLIDFEAKCKGEQTTLFWSTAQETNNSHFVIERACNEEMVFEDIAEVNGAGNSNTIQTYSISVPTSSDKCYYRLRQVDYDGKGESFPIIDVNCNESKPFSNIIVYPNPFNDQILIACNDCITDNVHIKIFSALGTLIFEKSYTNVNVLNEKIELKGLSKGVYFVELNDGVNKEVKQLVKN
jgi:hypothetical protein